MLNQDKHKVTMFRLLTDFIRDPYLSTVLCFKGGTACYFFYGLPRLSVDLDFDIIMPADADASKNVFEKVARVIHASGLEIKDKNLKHNTVFFLVSYGQEGHNIKIEISCRDYPNTNEIKDFYGLPIRVLSRSDIFAHKLVAATDRRKTASRDFFDIYFFFKEAWPINDEIVQLRTGKPLKEYLAELKSFIEKYLSNRNVLQGLGELVDEKQKIWVKNNLKEELLRMLSFSIDSIK